MIGVFESGIHHVEVTTNRKGILRRLADRVWKLVTLDED